MFKGYKIVFNTQKVRLKKKNTPSIKKIKNAFKGSKNLKIVKIHFRQKLKNKDFVQELYLSNPIPNRLLPLDKNGGNESER